ncbi:MAG: glycosyltransferase family 4 protein [Alkaliphilus sp.]
MVKILILANSDIGLYKFRKELIEELLKGNEVYISLPDGEFASQLLDLGCQFIDIKISRRGTNPITDFNLMMRYKSILKQVKPDVVLTYTIKPNVYGGIACRITKTPYITNITGLGTAVENGGLLQKLTLLLYRVGLKKASCVFFQNESNEQFFMDKRIVKSKSRLIPGSGVNLEHFHVLKYPPDKTIEFVFISRIMKQKGIDQYLDAAKHIRNKYPNTIFHVLGFCEEAYEDKLKKLQDKGIIHYHGMVSDVRDILKKTHCTIHPTYYPEGMSNVLLESAASGRPIITTDRSGCREIVDDGLNGYIVEQRNSKDLVKKIERFLKLDYEGKKQMGLACRKKVESEFDRQIVVNAYIEEIAKVIGVIPIGL